MAKDALLRCVCGYLAAVKAFEERFPKEYVQNEMAQIEKGFLAMIELGESSIDSGSH